MQPTLVLSFVETLRVLSGNKIAMLFKLEKSRICVEIYEKLIGPQFKVGLFEYV